MNVAVNGCEDPIVKEN